MQLHDHYKAIQGVGGEVLVFTPLDGELLVRFVNELSLSCPVLADPQRQVYRAYGLERGLSIHPRSVVKFLRLLWKEGRLYPPLSDPLQTGGDFVIDREGKIQFAFTSADPLDRPHISKLLEAIKN